jgi:hypothetical protein
MKVFDLREMKNAGDRLITALPLVIIILLFFFVFFTILCAILLLIPCIFFWARSLPLTTHVVLSCFGPV